VCSVAGVDRGIRVMGAVGVCGGGWGEMVLAGGVGGYGLSAIGFECGWGLGLCRVVLRVFVEVVVAWWVGRLWGDVGVMLLWL